MLAVRLLGLLLGWLLGLLLRPVSLLLLLPDTLGVLPRLPRKRLLAHLNEHRHQRNAVLQWVVSRPGRRWIRLCGVQTRYAGRIG